MRNTKYARTATVRGTVALVAFAVAAVLWLATSLAHSYEIETQPDAETLLYVKTMPSGAEVRLNGAAVGLSGKLLPVTPGNYTLVVDMSGHKPYKQQITIEDGRITRIEVTLRKEQGNRITVPLMTGRGTLKHDDGTADGKRSIGGSGEMIKFVLPEGNWKVRGVQIYGSRYGYPTPPNEDFLVYFLNNDLEEVASEGAPYRLFKRGPPRWVRIRFDEPVEVSKEFWVCANFNAERTKGVYVSYDKSTGGQYSKIGLPGADAKDVDFGGDWMIRVDLVPADEVETTGAKSRMTLKHDDGKAENKRSIGGSGEIIKYSLPEGDWKVKGIQLHGSRYGHPAPPAENFLVYFLNEDLSEVVATERAPYRLFNRGNPRWVRIRFKKPVEVPREFWVCVNFNAQQTKGVYVSYDTSTGGQYSKIGLPQGEKRDVSFGGDWMIRVDLAASGGQTGRRAPRGRIPRIVSTSPKVGATGVDASISEITVTFDRDMAGGFSWTGGGPNKPAGREGKLPRWRDKRTCVLPVTLEPGRYYRIGINSKSHQNFRSVDGVPTRPSAIYFTTVGATDAVKSGLQKPRVVSMNPPNGARNVDPNLREIRVTFDRPMGGGMSWTGGGPHFPEGRAGKRPHWTDDGKTCVLPVKLKPDWDYRFGLNSPSHKNFASREGVALDRVVYQFGTRPE